MHLPFSCSCLLKPGFQLDTGYNSTGTQNLGELGAGSGRQHYAEEIIFLLLLYSYFFCADLINRH